MSKTIIVSLAVALVSFGMVSDACQTLPVLRGDIVNTDNPAVILPIINPVEESQSANAAATPQINNLSATPQTLDAAETPAIKNAVVDPAVIPRIKNAATTPQIIDAVVPPQIRIAAATPARPDAMVTPQIKNAAATLPTVDAGVTPQIKSAAAILPTTTAGNWQYWEYCLAPSYAENKIYFSKPIPISSIIGKADDLFDSLLNKARLPHDVVQCPIAPNKPTLLFRQKHAVRFNETSGITIVYRNWDSDID
jgi:hypothetical protein